MHLTSNPVDWYAARAAGIAAYLLLSFGVLLGLTMAGRKSLRRWPKFAVEDVHRFVGLLVGTFVIIHVVTIAIDAWLPFSIGSILVPLLSRYRAIWVALGVVAAELLLALAVTNHYRDRLDYRFWRHAHYLNLLVWTAATLHGIGSGTDRSAPWLLALYALATERRSPGASRGCGFPHAVRFPSSLSQAAVSRCSSSVSAQALCISVRNRGTRLPSPTRSAVTSLR